MSDAVATPARLSPTAIPRDDAARLLSKLGQTTITTDMLAADQDLGAPVNPDGTLNLVHYAAWLVRELAGGAGS